MPERPIADLPNPVEREEETPLDQLAHAVSCMDSIASSFRAIAIVYATKNRESLEEKDAQVIRDLLDM